MSPLRWFLFALSALGLYSVANYSAEVATVVDRKKIFQDKPFWIIAHRGFSGRYPENTMLAIEKANELPIDAIELDVHSTRDGKIVVIHDATLDRTTSLSGAVLDYSFEDLRKADAAYNFDPEENHTYPFRGKGVEVPLLEDVFKRFPDQRFIIEIKQTMPAIEELLYNLIRKYKMKDRVIVASEQFEPLSRFRALDPSIATSLAGVEAREFYRLFRIGLANFYRPAGDALQIPEKYRGSTVITETFVESSKKKGLILHVWTVNQVDAMERLIDLGVDGLISDYPDRLIEVANRKQKQVS
jgi:glycerophosphoryl diester phosphodiesterase